MLKENIEKEYLESYKAKDEFKVSVLRMLRTAIKNFEIAEKRSVDDNDIISIIKKEAKQRKETAQTYKNAGKEEAAERENKEIEYLYQYLPAQLDEHEVEAIVTEAISSTGASNQSQIGQVIGVIMKKHGSQVDGSIVSKIVREKLK